MRIVAPNDVRKRILQEQKKISAQDAMTEITKTDKERVVFHKKHFQKDITQADQYDLCLNIEKLSVEESVHILVENYKLFTKDR